MQSCASLATPHPLPAGKPWLTQPAKRGRHRGSSGSVQGGEVAGGTLHKSSNKQNSMEGEFMKTFGLSKTDCQSLRQSGLTFKPLKKNRFRCNQRPDLGALNQQEVKALRNIVWALENPQPTTK